MERSFANFFFQDFFPGLFLNRPYFFLPFLTTVQMNPCLLPFSFNESLCRRQRCWYKTDVTIRKASPTCNKIELTNFVCSGTSHFLGKVFTGLVTYTYFAREFLPKTYLEIFFPKKQNRSQMIKGRKKYQIMNLMVPSAWNKDYFIFFLSTFHPDSLGK